VLPATLRLALCCTCSCGCFEDWFSCSWVLRYSVCRPAGCCLCRLGKGTWATWTGSGVVREIFHATCCTYLDDNGLDFRCADREFRHWPDGTAIENDVWKLALIGGAFARTNGQPLTGGYICAVTAPGDAWALAKSACFRRDQTSAGEGCGGSTGLQSAARFCRAVATNSSGAVTN
jgi:hypothetical protein